MYFMTPSKVQPCDEALLMKILNNYINFVHVVSKVRGVGSNFGLVRQKIWGLPVSGSVGNVYIGRFIVCETHTSMLILGGLGACPPRKF